MIEYKQIDVIPNTNAGIVREVIDAMFYKEIYNKNLALKTARYNYYRAKRKINSLGSDIFIIFKLYGYIIEVEGDWYGNGNDESWFSDYNWYFIVKEKSTDWGERYSMGNPYNFAKSWIDS